VNTLTVAVAAILAIAAVDKVRSAPDFYRYLRRLGVPGTWTKTLGNATIAIEIVTAVLLIIPSSRSFGIFCSVALSTGFVVLQVVSVATGRGSCACFGRADGGLLSGVGLSRALTLLLATLGLQLWDPGRSHTALTAMEFVVGFWLAVSLLVGFRLISEVIRLGRYRSELFAELGYDPRSGQTERHRVPL
jgi:hypothetical protein